MAKWAKDKKASSNTHLKAETNYTANELRILSAIHNNRPVPEDISFQELYPTREKLLLNGLLRRMNDASDGIMTSYFVVTYKGQEVLEAVSQKVESI